MSVLPEVVPLALAAIAASHTPEAYELPRRVLFVAACLLLPVVWGVFVNWLFNLWQRLPSEADDDRIFPDYQI